MSIYKPVADFPQRNKYIHIKVVQKFSQSCPKAVPVWMFIYKPVVGVPLRYKHIRPKFVSMNIYIQPKVVPKLSKSLQTCGRRPSKIQTYSSQSCLNEHLQPKVVPKLSQSWSSTNLWQTSLWDTNIFALVSLPDRAEHKVEALKSWS